MCGEESSNCLGLEARPLKVQQVRNLLGLNLDLETDKEAGFPSVICRKCFNFIDSLSAFKKSVFQGQESIKRKMEMEQRKTSKKRYN